MYVCTFAVVSETIPHSQKRLSYFRNSYFLSPNSISLEFPAVKHTSDTECFSQCP